jgi:hypothetical protein
VVADELEDVVLAEDEVLVVLRVVMVVDFFWVVAL